jgi:hypothetical protein
MLLFVLAGVRASSRNAIVKESLRQVDVRVDVGKGFRTHFAEGNEVLEILCDDDRAKKILNAAASRNTTPFFNFLYSGEFCYIAGGKRRENETRP